jgi:hypothetical protein
MACGPSNVSRFVMAIIIDSVNRVMLARWLTHVVTKCSIVFSPFITKGYTPPSVERVSRAIRVKAPLLNRCPDIVKLRLVVSVLISEGIQHFLRMTSTARRLSIPKRLAMRQCLIAAITNAMPTSDTFTVREVWSSREDSKTTKTLSSEIDEFSHKCSSLMLSMNGLYHVH